MRVFIIDDDLDVRQTLRSTLEEEEPTWEVEDRDFDGLDDALERFRPDLLVLDLLEGSSADAKATGNEAFGRVWGKWFCPIVVYSAFPDEQKFDHALAKPVTKGAGSELKVLDQLRTFAGHAETIQRVHRDFDARIREALRDSVDALTGQAGMNGGNGQEVVVPRAIRRLVAARVDVRVRGEGKLQAWERFIVPPLGNHLLTGDLLRLHRDDGPLREEDFRLVLTPSCDLVPNSDHEHDVEHVLVAHCERVAILDNIQLEAGQEISKRKKDKLHAKFTEGLVGHLLPIPAFRGYVPMMVANLGRLELLEWNQLEVAPGQGSESAAEGKFRRVASTDSPFREMVVWAYLRVTGRPGLPEIDVTGWLDDLSDWLARQEVS